MAVEGAWQWFSAARRRRSLIEMTLRRAN